jgi:hypothetical protein
VKTFVKEKHHIDASQSAGHKFRTAKEEWLYEDELFFIAQMFEDDWTPQNSVIDFDDGTINNVPLRQYG